MMYDVSFQLLLEALKQSGGDISDGSHAVLFDSLYDTSSIEEPWISEAYWLNLQDISHFVELLSASIDLGAHGQMLFSALQLKT